MRRNLRKKKSNNVYTATAGPSEEEEVHITIDKYKPTGLTSNSSVEVFNAVGSKMSLPRWSIGYSISEAVYKLLIRARKDYESAVAILTLDPNNEALRDDVPTEEEADYLKKVVNHVIDEIRVKRYRAPVWLPADSNDLEKIS